MHFDWLTYSDNKISETATTSSGKSGPTRSKTDSITTSWDSISKSDPELLPYTALLQRSSTMKSTKVNGYGDLSKRLTERRDSFEVKKAWLSARMRDREDEFVDWHDIRYGTYMSQSICCVTMVDYVIERCISMS